MKTATCIDNRTNLEWMMDTTPVGQPISAFGGVSRGQFCVRKVGANRWTVYSYAREATFGGDRWETLNRVFGVPA